MDNRIREIELRLARAKTGLAEGGREDYLKQLFLLDAEIRAAIRENGVLPEHLRELLQDTSPPRKKYPGFNATIAFATMLLVAAGTFAVSWVTQSGAIELPGLAVRPAALADSGSAIPEARNAPVMQPAVQNPLPVVDLELVQDPGALQVADNAALEPVEEPASEARLQTSGPVYQAALPAGAEQGQAPSANAGHDDSYAIAVRLVPPMVDTPDHSGVSGQPANPLNQPGLYTPLHTTGFDWTIARFALPTQDANKDQEITVVNNASSAAVESGKDAETKDKPADNVDKKLSTSDGDVDN